MASMKIVKCQACGGNMLALAGKFSKLSHGECLDCREKARATEARARELYEASRKNVSGRPAWEQLNPNDAYDMGMRERAFDLARAEMEA